MDLAAVASAAVPLLLIAGLRTVDVALGVVRVNLITGGRRRPAAAVAALEGACWVAATSVVVVDVSPARVAAYAGGVALGTVAGMAATHASRAGMVTVRAYIPAGHDDDAGRRVADAVRATGHAATLFRGEGRDGPVDMLLSTVRRRDARTVVDVVVDAAPHAFVTVDNEPAPLPVHAVAAAAPAAQPAAA